MSQKYKHILSPLKIGNVVLKNRIMYTKAQPHFLQGCENAPNETIIRYYSNVAKNGAAIVTVKAGAKDPHADRSTFALEDMKHWGLYDIHDYGTQNYYSQLADMIHFHGSLASINIQDVDPEGVNISEVTDEDVAAMKGEYRTPCGREITKDEIKAYIDQLVESIKLYQSLGFDMCNIYMSYRASILACSLSPAVNKRTDEYGGNLENRSRMPLELFKAIKAACGQDFLIEIQISGTDNEDGYSLEDNIEYMRIFEDYVDIMHIRGCEGSESHPTGFNSVREDPITMHTAEAIKKAGVNVVTAPCGGFQDLDLIEEFISTGKTDMVAMARGIISDSEYYKKMLEGRGDDVVPCILCNKCHVPSLTGPWYSICSVNPEIGIQSRVSELVPDETTPKKVAVIGGGPAGMRAALIAKQRGHEVTLFEKEGILGGQLCHSDYSKFKWPVRDYKNWLIYQLDKQGIEVRLNTPATPELVSAGGFDAVIAATGAVPKRLDISGGSDTGIFTPIDVYGNESQLGKHVVIVGGSETGAETALHLGQCGHKVTILTRKDRIAYDANPVHYIEMFTEAWEKLSDFTILPNATTKSVTEKSVTYTDEQGAEHTIECDSVVVSAGVSPLQDEAIAFSGITDRFFMIGDCYKVGNIHHCSRQAYAAATAI